LAGEAAAGLVPPGAIETWEAGPRTSRHAGRVMSDQDEGADGSSLETCAPMEWAAGGASADEQYILRLQRRMRACALRGPDLLPLFGMKRASLSRLLADARNTFSRERTLETVRIPNASPSSRLHVLGDLHGDVFSFFKALEICGTPSDDNRLVIAGDLVDRGCFGVELLICVLALKVWRPTAVTVIRGNHESTSLMERYGTDVSRPARQQTRSHSSADDSARHAPRRRRVRGGMHPKVRPENLQGLHRHPARGKAGRRLRRPRGKGGTHAPENGE
jgi:Calcineurin-like phosphoesterase